MLKQKGSTRLGEILISKGLITPAQLAIATHEQTKRNRLLNVADSKAPHAVKIGEILVEFGFIDQLDLKRGLNWQQRLRHVSIAMALCAPFMAFAPSASAAVSSTSSSVSTSSNSKSVFIEAENYSTMSGVFNQSTTDTGGGQNVANLNQGDWMSYTNTAVIVPETGTYTVTYRVAATNSNSTFELREASNDAVLDKVSVPNTGGWQTWVNVTRTITLTKGTHSFKVYGTSGNLNINWFKIDNVTLASAATSSSSSSSSTPAANKVNPFSLTIQAESYVSMGGVFNQATTDTGGGQNVANLNQDDWMSYTNSTVVVPETGTYTFTYRVATTNSNSSFELREASTDAVLDKVNLPNTTGWQTWVDVTRTVTLTKGTHSFKIYGVSGNMNINWFKIENAPTASVASSSKSSASSSSASSIASFQPLTVQVENYANMSGVFNQATTDTGGGQNIANLNQDDWMSFSNVSVNIPVTGAYTFTYRIATTNGTSSFTLREDSNGAILDTVSVPNTSGWQNWVNVVRQVTLTKGVHTFRIYGASGNINMNWFKIEQVNAQNSAAGTAGNPSSTPTSSSSSSVKSTAAVSSAASSAPSANASSSTAAKNSSSSTATQPAGPVALSWAPPIQRENGKNLDITELGGYEIRYKKEDDANYTYVTIKDAFTDQYRFSWLEGNYEFQIAAFDKNGIYSNFADLRPKYL